MKGTGLNSLAFVWIVAASIISDGLFIWPLHIVLVAGQNAELAILFADLWAMALALLIPSTPPRGPFWRWLFTGFDIAALTAILAMDAIMLVELFGMMQTFYYFNTPRWALLVPYVAVIGMASVRRNNVPWRVVALWVPLLFLAAGVIIGLAFTTVHNGRVLLPNSDITLFPILRAVTVLGYLGVPVGVTMRLVRGELAEPPKRLLRMAAIGLTVLFLTVLYVLTMGALGPDAIIHTRWPVVFAFDHVTLDSTFFLSRVGILVVFSWTTGIALGLIVHLRMASLLMARRWPKTSGLLPVAVIIGWMVMGLGISSPQTASSILLRWLDPPADGYCAAEMALLLGYGIVRLLRRRERKRPVRPFAERPRTNGPIPVSGLDPHT